MDERQAQAYREMIERYGANEHGEVSLSNSQLADLWLELQRLWALEDGDADDEDGGFDYKFVVNEIKAASKRAEQDRQEAREKTRLFWEQHEREHPRDANGEWK